MQYSKFGLVFDLSFLHKLDLYQVNKTMLNDLSFLHKLDLYQVNKTMLNWHFQCFCLFLVFTAFVNFEGISI